MSCASDRTLQRCMCVCVFFSEMMFRVAESAEISDFVVCDSCECVRISFWLYTIVFS